MSTEHVLKTTAHYFDALSRSEKTFEVRRNDRSYQTGDTLLLARVETDEYKPHIDPTCASGCCARRRWLTYRVTYVYSGDPSLRDGGGIVPGYVVLGIHPVTDS